MESKIDGILDDTKEIGDFFSTRSLLYNLEPMGLGTPYVESLSSYITRLAIIHNLQVSALLRGIVAPILNFKYIKKELDGGITKDTSLLINENSLVALDFVDALEFLTGRNDIRYLTMLNWQGILPRKMNSGFRKWCPVCLNQMVANSKNIYEPLIWYLSAIKKCDIHEILLEDKCPNCKKKLSFLHSQIRIGYCQKCGEWLGNKIGINKEPLSEKEKFIYLNFKLMIENTPKLHFFPSKNFIAFFLNRIIKECGFSSTRKFASYLGFSYTTVYSWTKNTSIPQQDSLLKLAWKLDNTIYKMIYYENINFNININEFNSTPKPATSIDEIEYSLKRALNLVDPLSLTKLAEEAGFSPSTAIIHFPDLCTKIREKYLFSQKQIKEEKQKEIVHLLNDCLSKEIPISLTQFSKVYGFSIKTVRRYAPALSKKISSRYKEYLVEIKKDRIERNLKEIREIAFKFHNIGIYPSSYKISRELQEKNVFLYKEIRDGWRKILENLGYNME